MASSTDFVNYICEQLEGLGAVRSRKMFGEYMVYLNDKPVVIICDDRPMVKMLPCLAELLEGRPTEPPYEGAKDHYLLDPDDRETLREAVRLAEEVTPLPKKKAPKKKEAAPAGGSVPWDVAWPAHTKPEQGEIDRWVDSSLFVNLQTWMVDTYGLAPSVEFSKCSMDRGWNLKYKKGSKALCALYVRAGWFTAMVTLGAKQVMELEPLLSTFSVAFRRMYEGTPLFNGGKWLVVDVKDDKQFIEVQRLMLLKAEPVKGKSEKL
jgi:TfoX/Sxy family transcriptional regulator of competence genes